MKKVFIDSDIFVRDLRYPRDAHAETNRCFIADVRSKKIKGVTSIFNLFEVCGILSFNLNNEELIRIYSNFTHNYNIQILFPADEIGRVSYDLTKIFDQIQKRQSLDDAQISFVVNRFANQLSDFVSWNALHFQGRIVIPAKTPADYFK